MECTKASSLRRLALRPVNLNDKKKGCPTVVPLFFDLRDAHLECAAELWGFDKVRDNMTDEASSTVTAAPSPRP
jgi:hypothetical protein